MPAQVTAVTQAGGTSVVKLPFNTSLLAYPDDHRLPRTHTEIRGLQVWSVAEALCLAGPQYFSNNPREAEIALAMVRDPSELLEVLLSGDAFASSAARLAGALHFVGRQSEGDHIVRVFSQPGPPLRPRNPFGLQQPILAVSRERSPHVLRIRSMWASWRETVIDTFPPAPGVSADAAAYLAKVNERYVADAYNSLSIEGYHVSNELIARVARAGWNPEHDSEQQ